MRSGRVVGSSLASRPPGPVSRLPNMASALTEPLWVVGAIGASAPRACPPGLVEKDEFIKKIHAYFGIKSEL